MTDILIKSSGPEEINIIEQNQTPLEMSINQSKKEEIIKDNSPSNINREESDNPSEVQ